MRIKVAVQESDADLPTAIGVWPVSCTLLTLPTLSPVYPLCVPFS